MSRPPNDPLRFGITGCGSISSSHVERYRKYDDVRFVGFCDTDRERATDTRRFADDLGVASEDARTYSDHEQMLRREALDGVIVCTPHTYHANHTITALEHGTNVLVEKPLAGSTDEVETIADVLEQSTAGLLVNYQKRYLPRYRIAKDFVENGKVGALCNINAYRARDTWSSTFDTWRNDPDLACGGKLLDLGNHLVDTTLWLVDGHVSSVRAICDKAGANVDMFTSVSARLDDGTVATFNVSAKSPVSKERIEIVGMEGGVTVDKNGVRLYTDDEVSRAIDTSDSPRRQTPDDRFRTAVLNDDFPETVDSYRRSIELAELAYNNYPVENPSQKNPQ